jgi:hypothetical protein
MTSEVRYIIENRKFKRTWDDYLSHWEFIAPVLTLVIGFLLLYEGTKIENYIIGILLMLLTYPLTRFLFIRLRQLSGFEELQIKGTSEENFNYVIQRLKTLNIVELENDIHSSTINAKYRSTFIPPVFEWLTIVCLDDKILVNSRPFPASMMLWLRRNAMIDFIRACNGASR